MTTELSHDALAFARGDYEYEPDFKPPEEVAARCAWEEAHSLWMRTFMNALRRHGELDLAFIKLRRAYQTDTYPFISWVKQSEVTPA
jgi:hypothetical protein